jgi:hypothetical protein
MPDKILVFYGSYRSDRMGIRLANFVVRGLNARGAEAELVDAKAVDLPMLDRMYKEYPKGEAPPVLETLAEKIRTADAFVFITGEYNWGPQPGLKNLTDHFLEEWFWRPAAIASYSAGRFSGVREGPSGIRSCRKWGWWSFPAPWPSGRSRRRSMPTANPPAPPAKRCSAPFRGSPTISPGGPRPRGRSANARRRLIDLRQARRSGCPGKGQSPMRLRAACRKRKGRVTSLTPALVATVRAAWFPT